jgi:hypothetical protein
MSMLFVATLLIVMLGAMLVWLLRSLFSSQKMLPVSTGWIEDMSASRYEPMNRLLRRDDYQYLATQGGFDPEMIAALRRERRRVFRGYLRSLSDDFQMVCTALRMLLAQSAQDRPDLARILLKQKLLFQWGLLAVECRLLMDACGWTATLDAHELLDGLDLLGQELRRMIPASPYSMAMRVSSAA